MMSVWDGFNAVDAEKSVVPFVGTVELVPAIVPILRLYKARKSAAFDCWERDEDGLHAQGSSGCSGEDA